MNSWLRNGLFAFLALALVAGVSGRAVRPRRFKEPSRAMARATQDADFRQTVARVDEAFAVSWRHAGIEPAGRAPDLTILRRLSLALTGVVPSLEEIRAIEAHPPDGRVQWWLSHLFEDRRYGDYLAERWARVLVGVEEGPFIIYRRHRLVSWLSDQIHANRPYDELVRTLIRASGIWTTRPEVNFITVTVDQNAEPKEPDDAKLAGRVSRAFLGVRFDCVQCHNDKFGGPWKQADFHQLAAFFGAAEMSLTGVRDAQDRSYQFRYPGKTEKEVVPPKAPFNAALMPSDGTLRDRLATWVTHPGNRPFARTLVNRVWALLFNRPLVRPIDSIPLEGPFPPGMELLADDASQHGFDLERLIRLIAETAVFQRDSRAASDETTANAAAEPHFAAFPLTRLRPEQVAGAILQSAKLKTINADSHVFDRIVRFFQQNDFIKHYGDAGRDEFEESGGTVPQRLSMMNGKLVQDRTKEDLVMNASTRIGMLARDDSNAIETAYLATLTRRPTLAERKYFLGRFNENSRTTRSQRMEDLFWTLINSTEFSWNH